MLGVVASLSSEAASASCADSADVADGEVTTSTSAAAASGIAFTTTSAASASGNFSAVVSGLEGLSPEDGRTVCVVTAGGGGVAGGRGGVDGFDCGGVDSGSCGGVDGGATSDASVLPAVALASAAAVGAESDETASAASTAAAAGVCGGDGPILASRSRVTAAQLRQDLRPRCRGSSCPGEKSAGPRL